tara:strand:+ start:1102 stop:2352 length:1251 start_codon:yes stop_codon:yes gene_type:complete
MKYSHNTFNEIKNINVDQKALTIKINDVHKRILDETKNDKLKFLSVVKTTHEIERVEEIISFFKRFNKILVLGTGGSSLGGKTLTSLKKELTKQIELYFIENVDPEPIYEILLRTEPDKTGVIIISKSGETLETLAQFFMVENFFKKKKEDLHKKVLVITEDKKSSLKVIQEKMKFKFLKHDLNIGGRYSVFSIVGLLPAKLLGVDIAGIRKGGLEVIDRMLNLSEVTKFAPAQAAIQNLHLISKGYNQFVLMPYLDKLYDFSFWYRQLWAESIGKSGLGSTPINALGTVDQHSQIQLYLEGPKDKFITFIMSKSNSFDGKLNCNISEDLVFEKLHNVSMFELLSAECKATFETVKKKKIPTRLIEVETINEETLGNLLMHFILETIYTCYLLDINPYDQPAVEEGKKLTLKFLNK